MLLKLVLAVILIAWFLGISYSAALHGILTTLAVTIIVSIVLPFIAPWFEPIDTLSEPPKPKAPIHQAKYKPIKVPSFVKWVVFFVISYLITDLFIIIIGVLETPHPAPMWLYICLPTLPFDAVLIAYFIKKLLKKRTRK